MLKTFFIAFLLTFSFTHCYWLPPTKFDKVVRDLYGNSTADLTVMASQWTLFGLINPNNTIGQYNGSPVLGGPGIVGLKGMFSRTYTDLPDHGIIRLEIRVKMIGNWKDTQDSFSLTIDNRPIKSFYISKVGASDSNGSGDLDTRLVVKTSHVASLANIQISWTLNSVNSTGSFAISDLSISFTGLQRQYSALILQDTTLVTNPEESSMTGCSSGYYKNSGSSCSSCHEACQDCDGPSNTACFQCKWSYSLVVDGCTQCSPNCALCFGQFTCFLCETGFTLDFDGTCRSDNACNSSPYVIKYNDPKSFKVCSETCDPGSFALYNSTCSTSCEAPFIQEIQDGISYCRYPCNKDNQEYLYNNGSCLNSCKYNPVNESGYLFCREECEGYLDQNNLCLPSCPSPYVIGESAKGRTCFNPCEKGQYLHNNGSCLAECPSLYTIHSENGFSRCSYPCSPDQFLYSNGSCSSTCPSKFDLYLEGTNKICSYPCSTEEYLYEDGSCFETCPENFITDIFGKIRMKFCTFPCQPYHYLYESGSCFSDCPLPYIADTQSPSYFCSPPCSNGSYYYAPNESCVDSCEPRFTRIRDDIIYCEELPNPNNTNNTNATEGCGSIYEFKYPNGSCLSSCPFPRRSNSSYFCYPPCSNNDSYYVPADACVENCEAEFIRIEDDIINCDNNPNCTTLYQPDGSSVRNCTELAGNCPPNYFLFEDGTCNHTCPAQWIPYTDGICESPCGMLSASYPNNTCIPGTNCAPGFKKRIVHNSTFCDEDTSSNPPSTNGTYSAILEIYIRYNITLTDFNSANGREKFLKLLSTLLGVDLSQIVITNIREGSTIIESQVKVTSDSDSKSIATTKSKVSTMSQKFQDAVETQALNLNENVKVLNSRSSIVIPEEKHIQVEKSSSSGVAIGVGVALGVVAVGIIAFAVYKYRKNKLFRVKEAKRNETYRVEVNAGSVEKNQEEAKSFAMNSVVQVSENRGDNNKNDDSVIFKGLELNEREEQTEGDNKKEITFFFQL